ncbi:MAG: mannose-1-phosphate guanylyltransferase [Desulfobacteraceae bacterium]|jgi:mannose-1-phosphate guanylyltransferase
MFVVIMAGGSGTRFWPVSRKDRPKQFLKISGKDPMVVETYNRLKPLAREEEMILVLGREHLKEAKGLFEGQNVHILAEPVGRNTAPCIGLGAIYAQHLGGAGPVAFLPADHYIGDPSAFVEGLRKAAKLAELGGIVTLGLVPTRPETGYGYIQGSEVHPDFKDLPAYKVSAFVEKPDQDWAQKYLASGDYYWNAGIFVAKPERILKEIRDHLPDLYQGLRELEKVVGTDAFDQVMEQVYPPLDAISFDYGVMEKTKGPIFVLPCECGWSDVGSWSSLYALKKHSHDQQLNLVEGESLLVECEQSFVSSHSGRLVACLGLKNCLVIDTPDALLVADLDKAEEIRKIVEELRRAQKEDLL